MCIYTRIYTYIYIYIHVYIYAHPLQHRNVALTPSRKSLAFYTQRVHNATRTYHTRLSHQHTSNKL